MELAERFKKLYAGVVYDVLKFDLGVEPCAGDAIHRVAGPREPLVGPAFQCLGKRVFRKEDINDDIRLEMFGHIPVGSVLVIDGRDNPDVAHFGDISAYLARKAGVVGVVIEGYTRDLDALERMRFPTFSKGSKPHDAFGEWQVYGYGVDGSYIFADGDGVIGIPNGLAEQVCDLAEERAKREEEIRTALMADDPKTVRERFGRW